MRRKDCASRTSFTPCPTRWALAAAGAMLFGPATLSAQSVRVWEAATVQGDFVRLADIAQVRDLPQDRTAELSTLLIAKAPAAGSTDLIHMAGIREVLRDAGINLATTRLEGASRCAVHRPHAAQHSPDSDAAVESPTAAAERTLRRLIRRRVCEQLDASFDGQVELSFSGPAKGMLELSTPACQFEIRAVGHQHKGPLEFEVTVRAAKNPPRTERLSVFVRLTAQVVVAVHNINQSEIITADHVEQQEHVFTRADQIGVGSLSAVVGQQAKRVIPAGKMIKPADLKSVPLVRRNAIVMVTTSTGGIRVTLTGRALESGTLGEIIKLRNEASKEAFYARVVGLGLAEAVTQADRTVNNEGARP